MRSGGYALARIMDIPIFMNANKLTKSEVLAIIETYEGLIRQGDKGALAKWTEWKAFLCRMEGR